MNRSIFSLSLSLAALCSLSLGCDSSVDPADQPRDGELLFDLAEEDLVEIHDAYLATEDIELTRARLTAPFDCALYDDFCDQVGVEAAIEITGETIDMALDHATPEEINAHLDQRIEEVMQRDAEAPADDLEFRGSSNWAYDTQGNRRLAVRNGITTPVVGDRRAWTQSKAQKHSVVWGWVALSAYDLCANTGFNYQDRYINGDFDERINGANPAKACVSAKSSFTQNTYMDRFNGNGDVSYKILVHGCGSGALESGMFFQACPADYDQWF